MFGNCPARRYIQSSGCFLPAAGYRSTAGTLGEIGVQGDYWTSSPGGSNAYYLRFYSDRVYPANPDARTHAITVRCVKEFILVFFLNRASC
ncbi:MAG: hypothetical protein LBR26_05360 [Prevotella sp.]|nr:hypothetical protein [Prevotella sp.]